MNRSLLSLIPLAPLLFSCQTGAVSSGGSFDPLTPPGSGRSINTVDARKLEAGSYHRTSMETAFFSSRPKGAATADKLLPASTNVKVITDDGSYSKVELDSGEVGFVASVLLADDTSAAPAPPSSNAVQVYPPLPGQLPPATDPGLPTIPPVIDPDAPDVPPVPDIEPLPVPPDAPEIVPPTPDTPPAPLPPGNEADGG